MKKTIKIFAAIAFAALIFHSCRFLEVERVGKSDIPTYFSEPSALQPALNGSYSLLYDIYDKLLLFYPEVTGDLMNLSARASSWESKYNFSSTYMEETTAVGYIWKYSYNIIQNVNHIIFYSPSLKDGRNNAMIGDIMAQAYFIRALVHFNLCQVYAQTYTFTPDASHLGVPVMTEIPNVTDKLKRSPVKEVYSQVIADVEKSLSSFSSSYVFKEYLASPAACKAFLARIYLYMGNYEKAASYSAELMGGFTLTPRDKYRNMFVNVGTREGESILRLSGYAQGSASQALYDFKEPSATPSAKLKELFKDEDDVRLTLFKHKSYNAELKKMEDFDNICMKFYCTDSTINVKDKHYDPFVFRVSEMYLINAEASCRLGKLQAAADAVKALKARALGVDVSSVVLDYTDASGLDKLIMEERMKELCFEGHRLFDVARRHEDIVRDNGTTSEIRTLKYPDYRFILPIPYLEIESNKEIQQNPSSND